VSICASIASCVDNNSRKQPVKNTADYNFAAPKNWAVEKIPFPIEFAPRIPYKGFEDLRFTPGWEHTTSDEHWSYIFLWWLDGKIDTDSAILKKHLEDYYSGLLSKNITQRRIPSSKVIHPTATIIKAETESGDVETFRGTIRMLDYLDITFPAVTLNCAVHKKYCQAHTAIIFEISPQPIGHKVWHQLDELQESFKCSHTE
jgi:hypothetical protein